MPNVSTSGGVSTQQYQFTRAGSNLPQTPANAPGSQHAQSSSGVQVRITPENFRQVLGSNADVLLTPQDMKKLYEQGHLDVQRQFSTMESNEGILTLSAKLAAALVGPSKSIGAITIDPMFLEMIKDPNAEVGMGYTRVRSETLRVLPGPTPTESPGRVPAPNAPVMNNPPQNVTADPYVVDRRIREAREQVENEQPVYSLSASANWVGAGRGDAKANSYDSTLEGSWQEMLGWTGKLEGSKAQFVNANIINMFTGDMGQQNSYDQANYILNGPRTSRTQWASRRVDTTHTTRNPNDSINQASSNHQYHFLATQHRSIPLTGPFLEQYSALRSKVTEQGGTLGPAPAAPSMYDLYLVSNQATTLGDPIQNNSPDAQQNQTGLRSTYSTLYQQVTGQPVPADLDWNKVSMEDVYALSVVRDGRFTPAQVAQVITNNNGDISVKDSPQARALIASVTGSPQGSANMSSHELLACHRLNLESNFAREGGRTFQFTQADANRVHDLMAPVMASRGVPAAEIETARIDRTDAAQLSINTFDKDNQLEGTSGGPRPTYNRSGAHRTTMDRAALVAGTVAGSTPPANLPDTTANAAYGPLNSSVTALRGQVALDHMNPQYNRPSVDRAFQELQTKINALPDTDPNKGVYQGELVRLRDIDRAARGQYVQLGSTTTTVTSPGSGGVAVADGNELAAGIATNVGKLTDLLARPNSKIEPGTLAKFAPIFERDIAELKAMGQQPIAVPAGLELPADIARDAQGMVRAQDLATFLESQVEAVSLSVERSEFSVIQPDAGETPAGPPLTSADGQTPGVQPQPVVSGAQGDGVQPAPVQDAATGTVEQPVEGEQRPRVQPSVQPTVQEETPGRVTMTPANFFPTMENSLTQFNAYLRSALADGGISREEKEAISGGGGKPGFINDMALNMRHYLEGQGVRMGANPADMYAVDADDLSAAGIPPENHTQILNMLDRLKSAQAAINVSSEGNLTRSLFQNLSALSKRVEEFDSVGVVQTAFKGEMTRLASPVSQGGNPAGFDAMMAATYGFKPPSAEDNAARDSATGNLPETNDVNKAYNRLRKLAADGALPVPPNIGFVDRAAIGGANGAFVENAIDPDNPQRQSGRTILLARDLANQPERMREVYAEEMFHHLEILPDIQTLLQTNPAKAGAVYTGDAEGDEGRAGVAAMRAAQGNRSLESIQQAADHVRDQPANLTGNNFTVNNAGVDDFAATRGAVTTTDAITGEQIQVMGAGQRVEFSTQPAGVAPSSASALGDAERAEFSRLATEFAPRFREIDRGSGSAEEKTRQRETLAAEMTERFAKQTGSDTQPGQQVAFQWHNNEIYGKQNGQVTLWTGTGVPASLPKLPSEEVFAPGHEVNPINVHPTQGRQDIYDRGGFGRDPGTATERLNANFGATPQRLAQAEEAAANNQPAPEGTLSASFDTNSSSEMMRNMLSGAGDMLSSAGLSMMRQADKLMDLVTKWFTDVSNRLGDSGTLVSQTMSRDIENAGRGGAGEENAMRTNKTYDYFQNTDRRWDRNPNYQRSQQGLQQRSDEYAQRMGTTSADAIKRRKDMEAAQQRAQQARAAEQQRVPGQTTT
ncbi:MAG: hypothetical protein ACO1RX_21650 [Candidatus Sericytochromatia bacterium]